MRIIVAVLVWTVLGPSHVCACSCADYVADPGEALRRASLVVAARVVSIERIEANDTFDAAVPLVRLQVLKEWKGQLRSEYLVYAWYLWDIHGKAAPTAMLDCSQQIRLGEEYLVFASPARDAAGGPEALLIDACSPVGLLRDSAKAVTRLERAARSLR